MLKEAFAHRAPRFLLLNSFRENLLSLDLRAEPIGWFPYFVLCQHLENLKSSKEKKNLQQSLRRHLKAQALPFPHLTGVPSRWSRPPSKVDSLARCCLRRLQFENPIAPSKPLAFSPQFIQWKHTYPHGWRVLDILSFLIASCEHVSPRICFD